MDLTNHFLSYKKSLLNDKPKECTRDFLFSYPTADKSKFKNIGEYIEYLGKDLALAAESANPDGYFRVLARHQYTYIKVFETIVQGELDLSVIDVSTILALIEKLGWKYFKFCKIKCLAIRFKDAVPGSTVYVLPRYSDINRTLWSENAYCLDADEAAFCSSLGHEGFKLFLSNKGELKGAHKLVGGSSSEKMDFLPVADFNKAFGKVLDWSLPIGV
jgi:hypothetical protein